MHIEELRLMVECKVIIFFSICTYSLRIIKFQEELKIGLLKRKRNNAMQLKHSHVFFFFKSFQNKWNYLDAIFC